MGAALVFLALSGLLGTTFFYRHVTNRDCFNSEGRCFDAETGTVVLEQAGGIYLTLAIFCLVAGALLLWSLRPR